jgi:hypothetical protein
MTMQATMGTYVLHEHTFGVNFQSLHLAEAVGCHAVLVEAWLQTPLVCSRARADDHPVEPLISHRDVTTIMELLGDIRADVYAIRVLMEEDDGEAEENPEADG